MIRSKEGSEMRIRDRKESNETAVKQEEEGI